MNEHGVRRALREWLQARTGDARVIEDSTPLIASRLITSLQVMDLLLFVEELREESIDPASLRPGAFNDVDAIYTAFFASPATAATEEAR